jgi:hypothetical protein
MQLDADRYVLDREIVISAEIFFRGFIAAHSSGCMRNRPESLKSARRCLDERASPTQYESRRLKA